MSAEADQHKAKSILIVEDEKAYSRALVLKLGHAGFTVETAENGEDALDFLRKKRFDLVTLDLVIPKINGFEVLEAVKKENIKVPIMVLSNLAQEEDKKKIKELGAETFIEKSDSSIVEIVNCVTKFLDNKQT
jgi:DNA-binding response OmpR family regulator